MRLALAQIDITLGDTPRNLATMHRLMKDAGNQKADLVVFPECALSGYCFESREEAAPFAESLDGTSVKQMTLWCRGIGITAAFGMIEREGDSIYNTIAIVGPEGLIGRFRKVHLPWLGVDRFVEFGDGPLTPFEIAGTRVGFSICYDGGFPETSRILALNGADLIVLPTNWPPAATPIAEHGCQVRAVENTLYYGSSSRIGIERGTEFIGRSCIADPFGRVLQKADGTTEALLVVDIDPTRARQKRLVRTEGSNEVNRIADRRPELYGRLTEPHQLERPGGRTESK